MEKVGKFSRVVIDLELAFDFWSLFFGITRQVLNNSSQQINMCNNDYSLFMNKSIGEGIKCIRQRYAIGDTETDKILKLFKDNIRSVKPWIPYQQLANQLRDQQIVVFYQTKLESEYLSQLHSLIEDLPLLTRTDIKSDDLIISCDDGYKLPSDNQAFRIKPRKIELLEKGIYEYNQIEEVDFSKYEIEGIRFRETNKYIDLSRNTVEDLPEYALWHNSVEIDDIKIQGKIVKGFQRGSRQLGCPTANIEMTDFNKQLTQDLIPGIYSALGKFTNSTLNAQEFYKCVLSIGWNPVYENKEKTVEVYIMHDFGSIDFYGEELTIQLKSFMRAEALFSNFDNLILAIQCDVESAKVQLRDAKFQ